MLVENRIFEPTCYLVSIWHPS